MRMTTTNFHIRDFDGTVARRFIFIFIFANFYYFYEGFVLLAVALIIGSSVLLRVAKRIQIIVTLVYYKVFSSVWGPPDIWGGRRRVVASFLARGQNPDLHGPSMVIEQS